MQPTLAEIESLFHKTLERPKEERANFLWQECAGNTALFDAVHRLLAADEVPAVEAGPAASNEWRIGQRFGNYRIAGLLGKGGMGAAFGGG
jgi:hypothetical protein